MNRLENLPEIAAHQLGGLNADARMLTKIRQTAAGRPARRQPIWKPALAGALALALVLSVSLWGMPALLNQSNPDKATLALKNSRAAGGAETQTATEQPGDAQLVATVTGAPDTGVSVGDATEATSPYRNLFAPERSGNFPVILIDGAAYRMLISPTEMKTALMGDSLGEVTEYTLEPALSTGGIVSNIVSAGEKIYAVRDMQGAMVAAYVRGSLRVFQRISYAGTAVLGDETLRDTLTAPGSVTAMELTGVGVITNPETCRQLLQTLMDNAEYDNASFAADDKRSLLIGLDNGLLMQLMVGDDTVSACGTWSCPEFFEAYSQAVLAD